MRNKYGAKPTIVDNIRFHSKRESERYLELKLLERANKIRDLIRQPKFPIHAEGKKICTYIADFTYWDNDKNCMVVEDVKGCDTALSRIKRKLVEAIYAIEIEIIRTR